MTIGKKILIGCMSFSGLFFLGLISLIVLVFWGTSGLTKVADDQLAAIRSGDYAQAYADTSEDFQKTTSLDQFKAFVDANPALKTNESSSFLDRKMEGDEGTLQGNIKSQDGSVTPIIFHLVKQQGIWKIQSLQINPKTEEDQSAANDTEPPPTSAEAVTTTHILDVRVSDMVGRDGYVVERQENFATDTPEILASAYIDGARPGDQVQATLVYVPTGQNIGPATNQIVNSGEIVSSFSFTQPTNGWPVGAYRVVIRLADGQTRETSFSVK